MQKVSKLDNYHYFEVTDRSSVIMNEFQEYILEHPAVQNNKELKELSQRVFDKLHSLCNTSKSYLNGEFSENRAQYYKIEKER